MKESLLDLAKMYGREAIGGAVLLSAAALSACAKGDNDGDAVVRQTPAAPETPVPTVTLEPSPSPVVTVGPQPTVESTQEVPSPTFEETSASVEVAYAALGQSVPDYIAIGLSNCNGEDIPPNVDYTGQVFNSCIEVGEKMWRLYQETSSEEVRQAVSQMELFTHQVLNRLVAEGKMREIDADGLKDILPVLFGIEELQKP